MEEEKNIEKNPHLYKPEFTKGEVDECIRWFEERMDKLPATLRLNDSTTASNLPYTVKSLINVLKVHQGNLSVTFSGYMAHLLLIRQRLEENCFSERQDN